MGVTLNPAYFSFMGGINSLVVLPPANVGFDYNLLVNSLTLLFSIVVFAYGVIKIRKFIDIYKAKKLDATFNFYANMDILIRRLYLSISVYESPPESRKQLNAGAPSKLLKYIWGDESGKNLSSEIILLERVVMDFLSFLSTSHEQIPPDITINALKEWNMQKSKLVDFLNALMPCNPHVSPGYMSTKLDIEHKNIVIVLDFFMKKIETIYEEYIKKAGK